MTDDGAGGTDSPGHDAPRRSLPLPQRPIDLLPGFGWGRPDPPPSGVPCAFSGRLHDAMGRFRGHPVTYGNRVRVWTRGRAVYDAMLEAIDRASDHVNLETYIFTDDAIGRRFAEALAAKAEAGLTVNLIVDAAGCWHVPMEFFNDLEDRGVHVLLFNPVAPWRVRHGRWILNHRDHRKILVVDGRIAFTGGMNIAEEYASEVAPDNHWRDTHVRIEGPAVAYFQRTFLDMLQRKSDRSVAPADYYPRLAPAGDHAVRVLPSNPTWNFGRPRVRMVFRRALHAAEHSLKVTQSYFMPDARVLWSLRRAAERGVAVSLVVPSKSDVPVALAAGRSTYGRLLRSGVALHERLDTILHAKSIVVDGEWSILGSANMDVRSFRINHEISVDILGRECGERLAAVHAEDVRRSRTIDAAAWSQRPFLERLYQRAAGMLRHFM